MPAKPLVDRMMILKLLDECIALGLQEEELDILLVQHGPVDLNLLEECKRMHPGFDGSAQTSIRSILADRSRNYRHP